MKPARREREEVPVAVSRIELDILLIIEKHPLETPRGILSFADSNLGVQLAQKTIRSLWDKQLIASPISKNREFLAIELTPKGIRTIQVSRDK